MERQELAQDDRGDRREELGELGDGKGPAALGTDEEDRCAAGCGVVRQLV